MVKLLKFLSILLILSTFLQSCTGKKDEKAETQYEKLTKKKRINPNVDERAKEAAEKGGGLFNSNRNKSTTYEFATSNVLWRATLSSIEFMPLLGVDYSGGVITTDWYSADKDNNESIKLTVRFLSNEVSQSSIKIISHKKKCNEKSECKTEKLPEKFNSDIKEKIFKKVIELNIKDEAKK